MLKLTDLERRIIDISYKHGLSHLGSCLTSVAAIDNCYRSMKEGDKFVLSNGHAFLALAVVLEKYRGENAEELVKKHGTHPNRDLAHGIFASTGSLGMGVSLATGIAIANMDRMCYLLTSDGECSEGVVWESLKIAGDMRLENLRITVVANGYSALSRVDVDLLDSRLQLFYPSLVVKTDMFKYPSFLQGLDGHYKIINDEEYKELTNEK